MQDTLYNPEISRKIWTNVLQEDTDLQVPKMRIFEQWSTLNWRSIAQWKSANAYKEMYWIWNDKDCPSLSTLLVHE